MGNAVVCTEHGLRPGELSAGRAAAFSDEARGRSCCFEARSPPDLRIGLPREDDVELPKLVLPCNSDDWRKQDCLDLC